METDAPMFKKYNPPGSAHDAKRQGPGQVIDVAKWRKKEDEIEPYQEGARAKNKVLCPNPAPSPCLIGDHDYLFKQSHKRYPAQFWVEVIAYRLGDLMGVPVPPAFVGVDSQRGFAGTVIEWFYNYPGEPREEYIRGGDLIQHRIPKYDRKKGKQHNVTDLLAIIDDHKDALACDWLEHWSKVLCFDALIGNTDRHQDNWGIIRRDDRVYFSPAFDNGTAMGHELMEGKLKKTPAELERYIWDKRATHHLKWKRDDAKKQPHFGLLKRLLEKYPDSRGHMRSCMNFAIEAVAEEMKELLKLSNDLPERDRLTDERADFIIHLTQARKDIIDGMIS